MDIPTKNNRKILVTQALPYANAPLHLGHILEAVQTDIWCRFQNLNGNECHFFCADDTHGTPVMLKAKELGISGVDEFLKGPTALAFSYDEPTDPAKIIKEFLKDFDKPSVKGMIFDGEIFASDQFDKVANLPSKEQLLSKLVGMLNSPMSKLSSTLGGSVSGLLGTLTQLESKKGS